MTNKFFANLYDPETKTFRCITAHTGNRLRREGKIKTTPKASAVLFDRTSTEADKVLPVRANPPFFRYYPEQSETGLKELDPTSEMTFEHILLQNVFLEKPSFFIGESLQKKIALSVKHAVLEHRETINDHEYCIIDVFLELRQTKPYSYYYKWNRKLALEILVTHKTTPYKANALAKKGIQVFEAPVSKDIKSQIPALILSEEEYDQAFAKVSRIYGTSYILLGKFLGQAKTEDEDYERWHILNEFEQQCDELKACIEAKKKELAQLKAELKECQKLSELNAQNEALAEENQALKKESKALKEQNQELDEENQELDEKNQELRKKLNISFSINIGLAAFFAVLLVVLLIKGIF